MCVETSDPERFTLYRVYTCRVVGTVIIVTNDYLLDEAVVVRRLKTFTNTAEFVEVEE